MLSRKVDPKYKYFSEDIKLTTLLKHKLAKLSWFDRKLRSTYLKYGTPGDADYQKGGPKLNSLFRDYKYIL